MRLFLAVEKLKRQQRKGTISDSLVQESTWKRNVFDCIRLSKAGYVNQMKSLTRDGDWTHFLWGSKICKSFSISKRHIAVLKNFLETPHQVTFTVMASFDCHLCFKLFKTAAATARLICLRRGYSRRETDNEDHAEKSTDGHHLRKINSHHTRAYVCLYLRARERERARAIERERQTDRQRRWQKKTKQTLKQSSQSIFFRNHQTNLRLIDFNGMSYRVISCVDVVLSYFHFFTQFFLILTTVQLNTD